MTEKNKKPLAERTEESVHVFSPAEIAAVLSRRRMKSMEAYSKRSDNSEAYLIMGLFALGAGGFFYALVKDGYFQKKINPTPRREALEANIFHREGREILPATYYRSENERTNYYERVKIGGLMR